MTQIPDEYLQKTLKAVELTAPTYVNGRPTRSDEMTYFEAGAVRIALGHLISGIIVAQEKSK